MIDDGAARLVRSLEARIDKGGLRRELALDGAISPAQFIPVAEATGQMPASSSITF